MINFVVIHNIDRTVVSPIAFFCMYILVKHIVIVLIVCLCVFRVCSYIKSALC